MIRRFNYTKRQRIPPGRVQVRLRNAGTPEMSFDAELRLADLELPPAARVLVEAYYKSSYMRFSFGTIESISPPGDRRLTDIERGTLVMFRVKVVSTNGSTGRILAEIDRLAVTPDDVPAGKVCLLPVDYKDLGQEIWRLEFGNDRPVLELNNTIDGVADMVKRDGRFAGLVFPAVVREILTRVLIHDEHDDIDDWTDWRSQWLRFVMGFHPENPDGDQSEDGRDAWIQDAVHAWSAHLRARDRLVETRAEVAQ